MANRWATRGSPRIAPSLDHPQQEAVFDRLAESFLFKDVRRLYDKPDETTNVFIHKMMRLGLVRKVARGQYRKGGVCTGEG